MHCWPMIIASVFKNQNHLAVCYSGLDNYLLCYYYLSAFLFEYHLLLQPQTKTRNNNIFTVVSMQT